MSNIFTPNSPASVPAGRHASQIVRQFTPNWFTVTMGTGILSLALNQAPFATPTLSIFAEGLWVLNIGLFLTFCILYAAHWIFFAKEASYIFSHSVMSMFFGAIPMGLATIINGMLAFGVPHWGAEAVMIAEALWWLDMAMAIACGVLIPFLMFTRQDHSIEKMTAIWLLPIVAAVVAASSAGALAPHIADSHAALRILMLGYALWAYSVPLAMSILVILLLRLVLHKLPHRDMAASGWLSLGPIGTGALGLLLLGASAPRICAEAGIPAIGDIAAGVGVLGGVVLWGYGVWWWLLADLMTLRYAREGIPFNLGWWGFTFPVGVYAVATLTLARQTHLEFLTVIGSGLVIRLAIVWTFIAARTLHGAWHRYLFISPGLAKPAMPNDLEVDLA
jgi:C4-dicarboxylate transporter/malic acid transport protein